MKEYSKKLQGKIEWIVLVFLSLYTSMGLSLLHIFKNMKKNQR